MLKNVLLLLLLAGSSLAWWDASFPYRTQVNISSTSALTDYQAAVNITNLVYNNAGLVGSWHFSEATGTRATDSSGKGNDGTLTNGPLWTSSGKAGYALQLDGANDYVAVSDSTSLNLPDAGFSIEAWFKTGSSASQILLSKGVSDTNEEYTVNIETPSMIYFDYGAGTAYVIVSASVEDNQWHHIVLLYNTSWSPKGKVYVDGAEKTIIQSSTGSHIASSGSGLYLGTQAAGAIYYGGRVPFNGTIDEVRIYNRALSAQEIQARYNSTRLKHDYSDLRFTNSTDSSLPYWLESDNKAWVKVPSIPNGTSTIYAYYGNPSAASASNGTNAFDFFDDFDSLGSWVQQSGAWAASNGIVTYPNGAGYLRYASALGLGSGYYAEARAMTTLTARSVDGFFLMKSNNPLDANVGYRAAIRTDTGAVSPATKTDAAAPVYGNYDNVENVWNILQLAVSGSGFPTVKQYSLDRSLLGTVTATSTTTSANNFFGLIQTEADPVKADWLLVRKYASAEPVATMLSEDEVLQFAYRKNISLNNPGSALSDFQVNLTIDTASLATAGKMKGDCADLRFTDSTSYNTQDWTANYKYWIESGCNGTATKIWVKVPSIPNGTSTIYAYYGNASAANASNGSNTFIDFSDFNDLTGWTQQSGTWTTSNSILTFPGYPASGVLNALFLRRTNANPYNTDYIVRSKFKPVLGNVDNRVFIVVNGPNPLVKSSVNNIIDFGVSGGNGNKLLHDEWGAPTSSPATHTTGNWLIGEIRISDPEDSIRSWDYNSGISTGAHTTSNTKDGGDYWGLMNYYDGASLMDWILIRKYAAQEPTAAEQLPDTTPPAVMIQSPNSTTYNTSTVLVNFTATDNAAVSCTVRLNGTINSSTCGNYSLTLSNGAYTLNVSANDTSGNVNSSQVLFNVSVAADAAPPAVSIQSPANATYATGAIPVTFIASDDTAVSACTVRLNGTVNSTTCSNYSLSLGNGAYTLNVTANDTFGNVNSSAVSFTVSILPSVSNSTTTNADGLGNVSLNGIPTGASHIAYSVSSSSFSKSFTFSAGVSYVRISAKVTLKGTPASGKTLAFQVS